MRDLYLRFDSPEQMMQIMTLMNLTYQDDEQNTIVQTGSHEYALWEVGEIPGRSGYHVNMRIIDPDFDVTLLEPYQVYPSQPVCVWA